MTLNFFSQIDYASFKDGKSKEQDDGKQKILKKKEKILKKKQKNKHKHTKGSKKGKKQRDAQEDACIRSVKHIHVRSNPALTGPRLMDFYL